jgi:hypothetical protein
MNSTAVAEDSLKGDGYQSSKWVRFEDDDGGKCISQNKEPSTNQAQPIAAAVLNADEYSGAVINPETVHINAIRGVSSVSPEETDVSANKATAITSGSRQEYSGAVINTESVHHNLDRSSLSRSVGEDQQQPEPTPTAAHSRPKDTRVGMHNVDLRDTNNGRAALSTRISTLGNPVIRQGFGKLKNNTCMCFSPEMYRHTFYKPTCINQHLEMLLFNIYSSIFPLKLYYSYVIYTRWGSFL